MPTIERDIDVTLTTLDESLTSHYCRVSYSKDGTSGDVDFKYYYYLTLAFIKELNSIFSEISQSGILSVSQIVNTASTNQIYRKHTFSIFGVEFNLFVTDTYNFRYCPRPTVIRSYGTNASFDIVKEPLGSSQSDGIGQIGAKVARITVADNILGRIVCKLIVNYNEDFIDICYQTTTVNGNNSNFQKQIYPICTIIKCKSVTDRDAVYYTLNCNTQYSYQCHRLVFLDDIRNTYFGSRTDTIISSETFTGYYLFNQLTNKQYHVIEMGIPVDDSTKIELYKPICLNGLVQFSDNVMAVLDNSKVEYNTYYDIDGSTWYCPGYYFTKISQRILLLKI